MMKLKKLCAGTLLVVTMLSVTACGNKNMGKNETRDNTTKTVTPTTMVEEKRATDNNGVNGTVGGNGTAAGETEGAGIDHNGKADNIIDDIGDAGKDVIDGVENATDELINGATDDRNTSHDANMDKNTTDKKTNNNNTTTNR